MSFYELDPANYLAAPGIAWESMSLQTGIALDLIADTDMLARIEQ